MNNIEIIIENPEQGIANFEPLKAAAQEMAAVYGSQLVSPDAIKDAKTDMAMLRKLAKSASDMRIKIEREHAAKIATVTKQLKEVAGIFTDAAAKIDSQVKAFEARVARDDMTDSSWQMLDGRLYLVKRFDYRNNSVFFALDIENSILERTAFVWDNSTQIYVTDGAAVMELFGHGLTQTRMSWAECTQSGFSRTASTWHSQKLPIAVCLVKEQSILEMVPAETWLLLVLFVFCVANVAAIWRIIRLEVLKPARKLSDAMQQIQRGNIQFRLEDTHYRNSDDMQ